MEILRIGQYLKILPDIELNRTRVKYCAAKKFIFILPAGRARYPPAIAPTEIIVQI